MEGPELDILANLIDADDDFDENELANLDVNQDQSSSPDKSHNMSNINNKDAKIDEEPKKTEDASKKLTEMENYIKFLESQLKTQNSEKSKSPETSKIEENNEKSTPTINTSRCKSEKKKKIDDYKIPTKNIKKESISKSEKTSSATRQNLMDTGLVKKARVAHTPKLPESTPSVKNENKTSGVKRKAEGPSSEASVAKRPLKDINGVTDGFSGLRILNPLISSTAMERRMEGRKIIKVSSIQSMIRNDDIEGDWVTIAVLVQKLPPKTSTKGNQYSIWKLSDLAFHLANPIVSLFLFGENHKEHWKTSEGTVIALLNPSILPSREKQSKDVALTIDNPKKVMMMGVSQDFGRCQGTRKADGSKCSNFVNKSFGDFCEYHVRREYSKMRSKRMECQQGYGAPCKPPASKLKEKIASETFFYQGNTVSSHAAAPRKEKVTLKSLASNGGKEHLSAWKGKQEGSTKSNAGESSKDQDGPSEDFLNLLKIPSVGSRNLMRQLHQDDEKDEKETRHIVSASAFLKANKVQRRSGHESSSSPTTKSSRTCAETTSSKDVSSRLCQTPLLGRGLKCDDDLIFDENVPVNMGKKKSAHVDKGKRQALALVREVGPFNAKDPNDARAKKPSPKLQNAIKTKLESEDSAVTNVEKVSSFTLAGEFSLDSVEGQRILKAKSRHVGEVQQAEIEQEQIYFKSREKKEMMETKMLSIRELNVKVIQCTQCKYVAEKAASICYEENHKLTKLHVLKKFFSCKECKERTVAYGQRYPTHECRKCGAKNYEKCAMWQERSGPKVGRETLSIRGPEYAKFLNSLQSTKTNGVLPKYL